MGFGKVITTVFLSALGTPSGSHFTASIPTASFTCWTSGMDRKSRGTFDQNVYYGFDFESER